MTEQEINRAIAEHLGWRCQSHVPEQNKAGATMCWIPPGNHEWHPQQIPNFCGDLNAMREALLLLPEDRREVFMDFLCCIHGGWSSAGAPLRECFDILLCEPKDYAKTFLRAVGKWKETE